MCGCHCIIYYRHGHQKIISVLRMGCPKRIGFFTLFMCVGLGRQHTVLSIFYSPGHTVEYMSCFFLNSCEYIIFAHFLSYTIKWCNLVFRRAILFSRWWAIFFTNPPQKLNGLKIIYFVQCVEKVK